MTTGMRSTRSMDFRKHSVILILLLILVTRFADAQGAASTVVGNVKDPTGAAISGAKVTITNTSTGIARQTLTNQSGGFTVPDLDAGQYTVRAAQQGFKTEERSELRLEYQQTQRVDFVLTVGDVSQSVIVEANTTSLQTDDASSATVIDEQKIRDLPLNGRNFVQLAQLVPNATEGSPGNGNTGFTGQGYAVSVNGQRDFNNQYTLDGVDMTEARNPSPMFLPSIDAIQEFDVKSGLYSAEYGWKAGAHIDIAIKPGTNQFHGNAYEFIRNYNFDARNFFGTSVDPLRRNQFGGTLGGPIRKNKLFFFIAYDGTIQTRNNTQTGVVPTPQQLGGDFSSSPTPIIDPTNKRPFMGNIIPASRIDPNAKILGAFFPSPNVQGPANYVNAGGSYDDNHQGFLRTDYTISDRDYLFGRFATSNRLYGDPPLIADFTTNNPTIGTNVAIQETHIFTPNIINSVLLGFSYYHREIADATVYRDVAKQLTIPDVDSNPLIAGIPYISITGYSPVGQGAFSPLIFHNQNFQFNDSVSIQKGKHSIKLGIQVMRFRFEQTFIVWPRGFFDFDGFATGNPISDFLLGLPHQTQVANELAPGHLFNTPSSYYVQDDWKVRPDLTINAGFRYELSPPLHDARGFARILNLQTGELFPTTNIPIPLYGTDWGDFGPRLGFAYRPFGNSSTVIRGGAGLFYSTPDLNSISDVNLNPPFGVTNIFNATPGNLLTFENPYPASKLLPAGAPTIYTDDPNFKNGRTGLWNLDIQHLFLKNFLVDVGYSGSRTTHLLDATFPNQPIPGPGDPQARRRFPQYGQINYWTPADFSTYEGLAVKVERRLSNGLSFLASYTWSKALDLNAAPSFGDAFAGNIQNQNDLFAEKGLASFSRKHRLSFSYGYELPFGRGKPFASHINRIGESVFGGWQINGIVTWESGPPFTLFVPGDPAGIAGDGTLRPDRIANGNLPSSRQKLSEWFDTSAFVAPPPYTFGNSARDVLIGPRTFNMDLSLFKTWNFERVRVQLRGEAFNATNHPNFGVPGNYLATPTYGAVTSAAEPRLLQIAAKVSF